MIRTDAAELERIRGNLAQFANAKQAPPGQRRPDFYPEWCGVFAVNVEQLLDVIDRLDVPAGTGWPVAR